MRSGTDKSLLLFIFPNGLSHLVAMKVFYSLFSPLPLPLYKVVDKIVQLNMPPSPVEQKTNVSGYSFGNWVKRRRKALDLTQQELAQRVGCSLATIVKIESEERRPSRQISQLLAEHLEIPL